MKNLIFICLTLLLASCYDVEKLKKPENLIPKDKMVEVIVDLSIFNSAKGINKRTLEIKGVNLEQNIYKKHNIDSLQFVNSNNYYAHNVNEYEAIYNQVKDSLTLLKNKYTQIDNKQKKLKRKKDSIKQAEVAEMKDSIYRIKRGMKPIK